MNILKTVLSAGLGLGLSLSGVEVLAAQESRSKASKPSVMKSLFSFKDKKYQPNLTLSGFYGDKESSYGSLDVLYPLHQKNDRLLFVDLRGLIKKSPVKEFNVGGGYRWLSRDGKKLYGVHGFYDRKISPSKNWFNQLALGGEYKTQHWSVGANGYLPIGSKEQKLTSERGHAEAFVHGTNQFIVRYVDTEIAMYGADAEFGYAIPKVKGLKAYLGGYYFSDSKTETVSGPRASLVYDLVPSLTKAIPMLDRFELEGSVQHDKLRDTVWYAGIRLQMSLGERKGREKLTPMEREMTSMVRRDLDVVVADKKASVSPIWMKETGKPYLGQIITTAEELKSFTGSKAKDVGGVDVIGIKGTILVEGTAIADGAIDEDIKKTLPAVRLNYGQSITGQGITFKVDGRTYTADVVNSANGLHNADPSLVGDENRGGITMLGANGRVGHLLRVYTDNTGLSRTELEARVQRIEDLVLRVPENRQGGGDIDGIKSSVITNMTGDLKELDNPNSFGHVVIDHIEANSNVAMGVNIGQTGKLRLTASKFTVSEMISAVGGMAYIYSVRENGLVIESIDNNELVSMTSVETAIGLSFLYVNGPVVNNTFGLIKSGSGEDDVAIGVYVIGDVLAGGAIDNNVFGSIKSATGAASGISLSKTLEGSISGNQFSLIEAGGANKDAYGVMVGGDVLSGGAIDNNVFGSIKSATGIASGIALLETLEGSISGNQFGLIEAGGNENAIAYGVHVVGAVRGGSAIDNNVFGTIKSAGVAAGVILTATLQASVSGNQFGLIEAGGNENAIAYGVAVNKGAVLSGSAIDNNVFGTIKSAGVAVGVILEATLQASISGNQFGLIEAGGNENAIAYGVAVKKGAVLSGSAIDNNVFGTIKSAGVAAGVMLNATLQGSVSGNQFSLIEGGGDTGVSGVIVKGAVLSGGAIDNNLFGSIKSATGSSVGITLGETLEGRISGNQFSLIEAGGASKYAYGVMVGGDVLSGGAIDNNVFGAIKSVTGSASGIGLYVTLEGSISGNQFNLIEAGGDENIANGVIVFSGVLASGVIDNNVFGTIKSVAGAAGGILLRKTLEGSVSGNQFSLIEAGDDENTAAYGVVVGGDVLSGGAIDNNVFGTIKSATGIASGIAFKTLEGSVSGNQFSLIEGDGDKDAYGVYALDAALIDLSQIRGNYFNFSPSQTNAYGFNCEGALNGDASQLSVNNIFMGISRDRMVHDNN